MLIAANGTSPTVPATLRLTAAVSFLLHLSVFALLAVVAKPGRVAQPPEYLPVELVTLPKTQKVYIPAIPAPATAPVPKTTRTTPAPPAPLPVAVPVQQIPAPTQEKPAMSYPAVTRPQPAPPLPNGPATGTGAPAAPGPVVQQGSAKGPYQAVHRLTRLPNFRTRIEPAYPASERMAGVEARVVAEVFLNERGSVDDVRIRKSGGKAFDQAVASAVRASSFTPGYLGERPVATVLQIPFTFKLK